MEAAEQSVDISGELIYLKVTFHTDGSSRKSLHRVLKVETRQEVAIKLDESGRGERPSKD